MGPHNKKLDVNGPSILIHPLAYEAVDLAPPVEEATQKLQLLLQHPVDSDEKGPLLVMRGDGGGKTRAMVALHARLRREHGVLPILIAYDSLWEPADFCRYKTLTSVPDKVFALSAVSRMAAMTFDVPHSKVEGFLLSSRQQLSFIQRSGCSGGETIIAAFALFLAEQSNATSVVLMVDETAHAAARLRKQFPDRNVDAAQILHRSMLTVDLTIYGVKTALVLCSSRAGVYNCSKYISEYRLPEQLDVEQVVTKLFLVDVDAAGQAHNVTTTLLGDEKLGRYVLAHMATVFRELPMGVELVQDELRMRVNRSTVPYTLRLNSTTIRDIFRGASQSFRVACRGLPGQGPPDTDLMYATLFGKPARMDRRVTTGVANSLFINSLSAGDHPRWGEELPSIRLRTSIASLHAAAVGRKPRDTESFEQLIVSIYDTVCGWAADITPTARADNILKELSVTWIRLLLTVASRAQMEHRTPPITLEKFLQLYSLEEAPATPLSPLVRSYLYDDVRTPNGRAIPVYLLEKACSEEKRNTANVSCGVVGSACLKKIAAKVRLSAERPCALVVAAPMDCWDYALLYLGRDEAEEQVIRTVIFMNKGAQAPEQRAAMCAEQLRQAWGKFEGNTRKTIRRVAPLYVCQTSQSGPSTCNGDVIHVGANDSALYYSFIHALYQAIEAAGETDPRRVE
jgi:hypothetical protein